MVFIQSKQEIHRRSARLRSTKYKAPASEKKVSSKGKGRRHIFKLKNVSSHLRWNIRIFLSSCQVCQIQWKMVILFNPQPIKAPESVSTIITSESIFYKVNTSSIVVHCKTDPFFQVSNLMTLCLPSGCLLSDRRCDKGNRRRGW